MTATDVGIIIGAVISAATPGVLAWLQAKKIHTAVNSERTAMIQRLEIYHKEVVNLTLAKAQSDQTIKDIVAKTDGKGTL